MFQQTPVFADVAKYFAFPVQTQSTSNVVRIATAFATNFGSIKLMPDQYFVFTGFRCFTNYDNFGGAFTTAGVATAVAISPPFVPNNFTVTITEGSDSLFSNNPLSQAMICSSGYLAGKQIPLPTIYGPRVTFRFEFTDTSGLLQLTTQDAAIPLDIQMWMEGINVAVDKWDLFLNLYPPLRAVFGRC